MITRAEESVKYPTSLYWIVNHHIFLLATKHLLVIGSGIHRSGRTSSSGSGSETKSCAFTLSSHQGSQSNRREESRELHIREMTVPELGISLLRLGIPRVVGRKAGRSLRNGFLHLYNENVHIPARLKEAIWNLGFIPTDMIPTI